MVQLSIPEIQTIQLRPERPKSERLLTEQVFVRISVLSEYRTFGFRTLPVLSNLIKTDHNSQVDSIA